MKKSGSKIIFGRSNDSSFHIGSPADPAANKASFV